MKNKNIPISISSLWPQLFENHVAGFVCFVQREQGRLYRDKMKKRLDVFEYVSFFV